MPRVKPIRVLAALIILTLLSSIAFNLWTDTPRLWPFLLATVYPREYGTSGSDTAGSGSGNAAALAKAAHSNGNRSADSDGSVLSWHRANLPWFMISDGYRPDPDVIEYSQLQIFPEQETVITDRIINQLMYIPYHYNRPLLEQRKQFKTIMIYYGTFWMPPLPRGRKIFLDNKCPVDTCEITFDRRSQPTADAIIFKDSIDVQFTDRPENQIWILYLLEGPLNTETFAHTVNQVNWTSTYRHDSDLVAPYGKFVHYDTRAKSKTQFTAAPMLKNYAAGKTKKVAWFVSNCGAKNDRLRYARELAKYIQVDIYGRCGIYSCPRSKAAECFQMMSSEYKFYLAFENSNCRDYITEKFFDNSLSQSVLPIVMGAHPADYLRTAPPHSFIHVEYFSSPARLAEYLHILDRNDTLYNQYFRWKTVGTFVNTYYWCRLCAMLHSPTIPKKSYTRLSRWWRSNGTCVAKKWYFRFDGSAS